MTSFAKTVIDRDELASTSDLARELIAAGEFAMPMVVRARRQTAGRGQADRSWWSDEGSLTFTVAIDPLRHGLSREHEACVALAVAVGMIEVIEEWTDVRDRLGLRWPNDVEAGDGRKVAGILPERVESSEGARLLIGIGMNVSTFLGNAPEDVRRMAASLEDVLGIKLAIDYATPIFEAIVNRFDDFLPKLAKDDPGLAASWSRRDLLRGKSIRLQVGPSVVEGVARGIDAAGALLVETAGEIVPFHAGRVLRSPG